MSLLAAVIIIDNKIGILSLISASILLALSMAIYQVSICIYISFVMILTIKKSLIIRQESWRHFIQRNISCLFVCVLGCILYFISNKIALIIVKEKMISYQGLNNMTSITILQMIRRMLFAYKEFFLPSIGASYSVFGNPITNYIYKVVITFMIVFCAYLLFVMIKKHKYFKVIQLILLFTIVPLAFNSVFLITDTTTSNIHTLMLFQQIMIFISLLYILEFIGQNKYFYSKMITRLCQLSIILLVYTSIYFGYISNVCYTKLTIQQEQCTGYFNRLITRVQMVDGYKTNMPVAYINQFKKNQEELELNDFKNLCTFIPYSETSLINEYNWTVFMKVWCGYSPTLLRESEVKKLESNPQIKDMPSYPNDKSIQVINNIIVVKF